MKGYGNQPAATAEAVHADGLFRTGDIGRVDEDGYYYIVDRKKDLINHGGCNVWRAGYAAETGRADAETRP
jgi:long-chain acyl-CoA synthetase